MPSSANLVASNCSKTGSSSGAGRGNRGKLLQLQLDHRPDFGRIGGGEHEGAEINVLDRNPGDIEFFVEDGLPAFFHAPLGEGLLRGKALVMNEVDLAVHRELPDLLGLPPQKDDVRLAPAG